MKKSLGSLLMLIAATTAVKAAPQTFDFKDPKGVNNVVFKTDALLEAINGSADGVSGTVTFDSENPGATKGKIVVASSSLRVPNSTMQQHMHGAQWLDVAKNPEIVFEVKELKNVKTSGDTTSADATGMFSLKGITKEIPAPVKITYLKGKLSQRTPGKEGDLLVIRSTFSIKRSDFGINAGKSEDKVSEAIELTLSIAGSSPKL